ncbi:MAG: fused MFS/spermidine synthase, partial [Steroidobacteraceae bacterium]|nr:fused MFS/spermidine synthase [Steroidobacteraceae bacterium]
LHQPARPDALLATSPLNVDSRGRILFYDVGRSASVIVLAQDGGLALRTNGLPEALMDTPGLAPRFSGEFWLSPIATVLRPEIRTMLIVGYGGGVVVEGIAPSVRQFDVIELEPVVIDANKATRSLRRRDPLNDIRMRLITNDARGALRLTAKRYDAIVSQPSHPWTAGASHLYTREFMQLARAHLNDGGVFVQWMNVAFVNEALLRSLTATIIDVFGQVRIYRPDPNTLVFVGSAAPLAPEERLLSSGLPLTLTPAHYRRYGIGSAEDLVFALAADEDGARRLARGAPLITDDDNRIATSTVYNLGAGLSADAAGRILAAYDPLQDGSSWIYRHFRDRLAFPYIVRRNLSMAALDPSLVDRSRRIVAALGPSPASALAESLLLNAQGRHEAARQRLREAAAIYPDDAGVQYAWLQSQFQTLRGAAPGAELVAALQRLPPSAQATLRGLANTSAERYPELAKLDPILAQSAWTDPWRTDATLLRADWRAHVSTPERRKAFAEQAIELIDLETMLAPSAGALALRLAAGLSADRPEIM